MFDLGTMALRLVEETKGVEEMEEKVAGLLFEPGRAMMQRCTPSLPFSIAGAIMVFGFRLRKRR